MKNVTFFILLCFAQQSFSQMMIEKGWIRHNDFDVCMCTTFFLDPDPGYQPIRLISNIAPLSQFVNKHVIVRGYVSDCVECIVLDVSGIVVINDVEDISTCIPIHYFLCHSYPNPFNPTTNIEFALPHASDVSVRVYNVLGEEVAILVSEHLTPGTYKTEWNASGFASGVYFYRLQAGSFVETEKLLLIR